MHNNLEQQTLALAGVCQAASLVQDTARKGQQEQQAFQASIHSLVITEPKDTIEVFGSIQALQIGLDKLVSQLGNQPAAKDAELTRYIAAILGLERKLAGKAGQMQALATRISNIQRQQQHYDLLDAQMLTNLASIYTDLISPLGPKVQIAGNQQQLKQTHNQHKVRALLLCGVRAAVLWRQLGGKRRTILWRRRQQLACAKQLLSSLTTS